MTRPPKWFTVTAIIALLWNLVGVAAFVMDSTISPEDLAKLPEGQQTLYAARDSWIMLATALAVILGTLGSIGLLLKRKWALPVFIVSLLAIVAQDVGMFVLINGVALGGAFTAVLHTAVLLIAILLVLLSRKAIVHGWLR
jgi:hypothetical protein